MNALQIFESIWQPCRDWSLPEYLSKQSDAGDKKYESENRMFYITEFRIYFCLSTAENFKIKVP